MIKAAFDSYRLVVRLFVNDGVHDVIPANSAVNVTAASEKVAPSQKL